METGLWPAVGPDGTALEGSAGTPLALDERGKPFSAVLRFMKGEHPLATLNSDLWVEFRPIFGQTWQQNPSRTMGLVLQCRVPQQSTPQTNYKAVSWHF